MVTSKEFMDKIGKLPSANVNTKWGFYYTIELSIRIHNQIVDLQEQNDKIIEQNDEIISLLKEIRDK